MTTYYYNKLSFAFNAIFYLIIYTLSIKLMEGKIMRKAFICPPKYVQGENELLNMGYFVKTFGSSALLIAQPDDLKRVGAQLEATAEKYGRHHTAISGIVGGMAIMGASLLIL